MFDENEHMILIAFETREYDEIRRYSTPFGRSGSSDLC